MFCIPSVIVYKWALDMMSTAVCVKLQLMSGSGFLGSLVSFPKDTINGETVELLEPYLRMEDYNMETAKKVCSNVSGLLSWSTAMAFFYGVNKEVLPLKVRIVM